MKETQVLSLSWEEPLEKEGAIHSSILAWGIPMESQESDRVTKPPPSIRLLGTVTLLPPDEAGTSGSCHVGSQFLMAKCCKSFSLEPDPLTLTKGFILF